MHYTSNQYNYATPPYAITEPVLDTYRLDSVEYFTLSDNILDGSLHPVSGNVGIWGTSLSDTDGTLAEPLVFKVYDELSINAFRLVGSPSNYPVSFEVRFYNDDILVGTLVETDNKQVEYIVYFDSTVQASFYEVSIYKISAQHEVARVFNVYNPGVVKRADAITLRFSETDLAAEKHTKHSNDTLAIKLSESTHVLNVIDKTTDRIDISLISAAVPTNVHTVMKELSRRVYGKVAITYTDPMLEASNVINFSSIAYNSNIAQLTDSVTNSPSNLFTLYANDLTGAYVLSDEYTQVGWVSAECSGLDGTFSSDPTLEFTFESRPINALHVAFSTLHDNLVKDFTVRITNVHGAITEFSFSDNKDSEVDILNTGVLQDVVAIKIIVHRVARPYSPAVILEVPVSSTIVYKGYKDVSELMSVDLLEELTYEDDVEALGGISANEVTIVLDNSSKDFFFNSDSPVAKQLRRNRKIEPFLGVEIVPGEIEWHTLGTFWSHKWEVPANSLTAKVVGFDTLGLLNITDYTNHAVQVDKSIGDLIEYVLEDAKKQLPFIEYDIDALLYTIKIPYAWFERGSHTNALRRISLCYPMHIYCNRQGTICAKPQKLHLDYYLDEWSDDTNVLSKTYDSLYSTLPNIVNVAVNTIGINSTTELVRDNAGFDVNDTASITLQFTEPLLRNLSVEVVCDADVSYSYTAYSWGIELNFVGSGRVESIVCFGDSITTLNTTVVERIDRDSVRVDGAQVRSISSDFIQTQELAHLILDRIFSLSELDKFDATVEYRGDISLTINDAIILHNGIAPIDKYNIKRHQLTWNGGLTGSADLNT